MKNASKFDGVVTNNILEFLRKNPVDNPITA
jgi:hypothetical protein